MRFLIELCYCKTWIWTLHTGLGLELGLGSTLVGPQKKLKSPIKEDNIWATPGLDTV